MTVSIGFEDRDRGDVEATEGNTGIFSPNSAVNVEQVSSEISLVMRKPAFCICENKTKTQISFAVTAKLISAFVFDTRIVQSLYFLNPKFQAPSHLL